MKAIILKELRENARWAMLMFLAMAAALAYGLSTDDAQRESLVGTAMLAITGFGFPAIGFALGLLQVLQDSSTGRWGFLTHRPISRSRIFFAKIVGGLLLYFPAMLIPLAGAVYWVATPGHVAAPFDWHMVLPRLADLFGGLMWYAAGLLVAARHARWIGSRLMPVGMALIASCAAATLSVNLIESLLICAACLAILLPAAWGAFVNGGSFEPQPLVTRLLTTLSVGAGVFCAMAALVGFSIDLLHSLSGTTWNTSWQYYQVAADGRILVVSTTPGRTQSIIDPNGASHTLNPNELNSTTIGVSLQDAKPQDMSWNVGRFESGFQRDSRYLRDIGYIGLDHWFYVVQRRTIEGFDISHKQFIGSLGPGGFVPPGQSAQPFAEPMDRIPTGPGDTRIIAGHTTAYQVDLAHHLVTPYFVSDPTDPIIDVNADSNFWYVVIVTQKEVHLFEGGKERFHMALAHTYPDALQLTVSRATTGHYIFSYMANHWERAQTNQWDKVPWLWVVETAGDGRFIHEKELPMLQWSGPRYPWWVDSPVVLVYPPGLGIGVWLWAIGTSSSNPFGLREWLAGLAMVVVAVGATGLLVRRFCVSKPAKWRWMFLNALLGIPGIFLLLSLRQRLTTVPCPVCGKRRFVNRERCEHCNAPFNAPAAQGIEVFQ